MAFWNIQRHILGNIIFGMFFVVSAWVLWWVAFGMISDRVESVWILTFWTAAILFLSWAFFIITARNKWIVWGIIILAFLGSMLSMSPLLGIPFIILSVILAGVSSAHVRDDVHSRASVRIGRSVRYGFGMFVAAVSILVTGMYFGHAYQQPVDDLLPQFEFGERTSTLLVRVLKSVSPEFSSLGNGHVTVNEFLLGAYKDQVDQYASLSANMQNSPDLTSLSRDEIRALQEKNMNHVDGQKETLQQELLAKGRVQLSDAIGRPLTGSEYMSDVLSDVVNAKLRAFAVPEGSGASDSSALLASILALLIFITITSIAMLARFVWFPLLLSLFWACKRLGLIVVRKETREIEVIES